DTRAIMGTAVSVELWADDDAAGRAAIDAVMAEMHRIEAAMSPFIDSSELSLINREAGAQPVVSSEEMLAVLQRAQHYAELTEGAFDISFASVGYLYDYRRHIAPSQREIDARLDAVDYRAIELDARARTVRFR